MTPDKIAELRRLCEAATPGEWVTHATLYMTPPEMADLVFSGDSLGVDAKHLADQGRMPMLPAGFLHKTDAEYIAAANPKTVNALLDEVERLSAIAKDSQNEAVLCLDALDLLSNAICGKPEVRVEMLIAEFERIRQKAAIAGVKQAAEIARLQSEVDAGRKALKLCIGRNTGRPWHEVSEHCIDGYVRAARGLEEPQGHPAS